MHVQSGLFSFDGFCYSWQSGYQTMDVLSSNYEQEITFRGVSSVHSGRDSALN